jgi:hypothetical protein
VRRKEERDSYLRLPPVWLYLEDLEELTQKMKDDSSCKVVVERGEFIYDSLEELAENVKTEIHDLGLRFSYASSRSGVWITFERGAVTIHGDQEKSALAVLLLRRRVPILYRITYGWWWLACFITATMTVGVLLIYPLYLYRVATAQGKAPPEWIFVCIGFLSWPFMSLFDRLRFTRLRLYRRDSRPTYWERKGDDLVTRLIVSALTGLGGFLLGLFIGQHGK